MSRRRSIPWIHRWSRPLIAGVAALGVLDTAYLTLVEFGVFKEALCPTTGAINCQAVLSSDYAKVFGIPLALFGMLAYAGMALLALAPLPIDPVEKKEYRSKVENWTWLLLFAGAIAMMFFSGYLFYLMAYEIKAFCIYCLASVVFSIALFVLTLIGREWDDIGQLFFTGIVVGMIALIGTLGVYATGKASTNGTPTTAQQTGAGQTGPAITTTSGPAEIALARHLTQIGAKEYGAFWCPHCYEQKQLFGKEASKELTYIECDPRGANAQPNLCEAAKISGYPTWEINGQLYSGVQSLEKLADLSGYQGSRNFKRALR